MKNSAPKKRISRLKVQMFVTLLMTAGTAWAQDTGWTGELVQRYSLIDTMKRTQGLTMDPFGHVWFSSKLGLMHCNGLLDCLGQDENQSVSKTLEDIGGNHIGDIDYAQGFIFAPIEDAPRYLHPSIAIFNGQDLQHVKTVTLPPELQPDGVPWVTVDPSHQILMSAEYTRATHINIYDLNSGKALRQIQMSMPLNEVQGGKFWKDHLYMTATSPQNGFAVYDMDLKTGEVQKLFQLDKEITEVEGLSVVEAPSNKSVPEFFVLGIAGHAIGSRAVIYLWKQGH
jgi:hypothetical protein